MKLTAFSKACCFALSPFTLSLGLAQSRADNLTTLQPVVVTGNPLRDTDLAQPIISIGDRELRRRSSSSLGETLDGLPGVSSTYFGPISSRPIVRGQSGDRIKLLSNAGPSFDVSALSFDHAVPVNSLSLERVEVLRGPASLLYGGNAIGGVVNLIDRRLPRFESSLANGLKLGAELGLASADKLRSAAASIDVQQSLLAWHFDVSKERRRETRIPMTRTCTRAEVTIEAKKICNSQAESSDFGLGASVKLNNGFVGGSFSQYKTIYGSPAEDEVSIDMRSRRFSFEGLHRFEKQQGLQSIKWQINRGNYQHQELEGSEVGTTFTNRGTDARLELTYRASPEFAGVLGFQAENGKFSAIGEEAFLPPSKTRSVGAFVLQDWRQPWGKLSAGLRVDRVKVNSLDDLDTSTKQFTPVNLSLGGVYKLNPQWQVTANASAGQRAPKDFELFANGPHVATNTFEIGDSTLALEKYRSVDVGIKFNHAVHRVGANVHLTRFSNYIGLERQGTDPIDGLPVYAYVSHRAAFRGFEVTWDANLSDAWQIKTFADRTIATNLQTNQALPRIAPLRVGASIEWTPTSEWTLDFGVNRSSAQNRVPEAEAVVKGSTLINAAAQWSRKVGQTQVSALFKVDNLSNRLAYSASSILTQTAPGRVPLPGRNVQLKLKLEY
jgi:iron complex outermembrane recepter protein